MVTELAGDLLDLLNAPSICLIATIDPDGAPQLTETWVESDGTHIVINTIEGFRKLANVRRDPRVAITILDSEQPVRYFSVRGTVVDVTSEGGAEGIERLSHKYTGGPYRPFRPGLQTRVLLTIRVDRIVHPPGWAS